MKLFTTVASLFLFFCCKAQTTFEVGAGANPAINQYSYKGEISRSAYGSVFSVNPDALVKVDIKNKVGICTGLEYLSKCVSTDYEILENISGIAKISYRYFSVPLYVTYNLIPKKHKKFSAGLIAIADFSLLFAERVKVSGFQTLSDHLVDTTLYYSKGSLNDLHHFAFTVGGGVFAGYNFNSHFNIIAYPFYKVDITEITYAGNDHFTYFGIGVSIFYRFKSSGKSISSSH